MSGFAEHSNPMEECKKNLTLLQAQRDALELEANSIASELNSPGVNGEPPVGVKGSLVDSDGFPLAGFDLFNVREKRRRFCCIQTNHKAIMAKIEKALHALHEFWQKRRNRDVAAPIVASVLGQIQASMSPQPGQTTPGTRIGRPRAGAGVSTRSMVPIARVNQVSEGSPAAAAGLTVGDLVLRFGNVDISHPKGLGGVVDVVREKEGQKVPVVVLRHGGRGGQSGTKDLVLVPQAWEGRGLLGVHLLPP